MRKSFNNMTVPLSQINAALSSGQPQHVNPITYFAKTDSRGKAVPFGIKAEDRLRHTYVIGKTGMGKSTLLENMAVQDIQNGNGLTFIDPHGSTAEKLLDYIPEDRVEDVLYLAPFDLSYPISFNVMENVDADKRHLVVNGLMSTFEKIWVDAWSARMAYILQNTLLALLEYPGATLLAVNRMYTDKEFRKNVVAQVTDPTVRSFWVDEFAKYTDRFAAEATPAIQNKIGQFSSNSLVRNIIGQPRSAFDIRKLMDERKIFIVNLSKGRVGEGNANLLGSMLITKIYLAAMSRADASPREMAKLPPHYLHVDEFQSFANKSFADILSEARKYKLALTIAHQYIEQMEEEVRAAVFGNVGTMITFRVGAFDAEVLEKEFSPTFTLEDIVNLAARQIYLKLMIDGVSSQPFSATTLPPIEEPRISHRDRAIAYSRRTYSQPREEVEAQIRDWHAPVEKPASETKRSPERQRTDSPNRPLPPRVPATPRPLPPRTASTSTPSPRPASPATPRPSPATAYQKKEERSPDELRSILSSLVKKESARPESLHGSSGPRTSAEPARQQMPPLRKEQLRPPLAARSHHTERPDTPTPRPAPTPHAPQQPKRLNPTEEAKAVEKGKDDLKAALSALIKPKSATPDTDRTPRQRAPHVPRQETRDATPQASAKQSSPPEQRGAQNPAADRAVSDEGIVQRTYTPRELPEQELRSLLGKLSNDTS